MKKLLLFFWLMTVLTSCSSQQVATAPSARYPEQETTRLRRKNSAQDAIVVGRIDITEADGSLSPEPGLSILVDGVATMTDANSNYSRILQPGERQIQAGGVGFNNSRLTLPQVRQGDSIRINFHLLRYSKPTTN